MESEFPFDGEIDVPEKAIQIIDDNVLASRSGLSYCCLLSIVILDH